MLVRKVRLLLCSVLGVLSSTIDISSILRFGCCSVLGVLSSTIDIASIFGEVFPFEQRFSFVA